MNHNTGYSIPVTESSVIVREADGTESRYTPEQWRYKQIMDKLEAIEARLERLESRQSP